MTIRPLDYSTDAAGVTDLLSTSLSKSGGADWLRWKHRDNPFGISPAYVAVLDGKIVGTRFFLCWQFIRDEQIVPALRPVDTVTHPDARGKGVFKKLTLHGLAELTPEKDPLIFNTPNNNSLPGYLKMGWDVLPRTFSYYYCLRGLTRLPEVRLSADPLGKTEPVYQSGTYTTQKNLPFLSWRYKGEEYSFATYADGTPGELVYRIIRVRGVRALSVSDFIGLPDRAKKLIDATAAQLGIWLIHLLDGEGPTARAWGIKLQRGSSLVAIRTSLPPDVLKFDFSSGDLESIL